MNSPIFVSLDIDNTLAEFNRPFDRALKATAGMEIDFGRSKQYDISKQFSKCGKKIGKRRAWNALMYMLEQNEYRDMPVIKGAVDFLRGIEELGIRAVLNTKRDSPAYSNEQRSDIISQTDVWARRAFGDMAFKAEVVTDNREKALICEKYNCILHLDDHIDNLLLIDTQVTRPVLMITERTPWNHKYEADKSMPRLKDCSKEGRKEVCFVNSYTEVIEHLRKCSR